MKISPVWEGFLTFENMDAVAEAIRALLTGKEYAIAIVNKNTGPMPSCYPGLSLGASGVEVKKDRQDEWGCRIDLWSRGYGQQAWYVKVFDGIKVDKSNSTYIVLGFDHIEITTLSRPEYVRIAVVR